MNNGNRLWGVMAIVRGRMSTEPPQRARQGWRCSFEATIFGKCSLSGFERSFAMYISRGGLDGWF